MAYEITNSVRSGSIIRVVNQSLTVNVANLSATSSETVTDSHIRNVIWSTNTAITVTRNEEIVLNLYGNGTFNLDDYAHLIAANSSSDIVINCPSGTIILDLAKVATYSPSLEGM
jgi:predicted transcriptional regulator YheO